MRSERSNNCSSAAYCVVFVGMVKRSNEGIGAVNWENGIGWLVRYSTSTRPRMVPPLHLRNESLHLFLTHRKAGQRSFTASSSSNFRVSLDDIITPI